VRANPAWDALLGRPVRELERTPFADLVHDEDRSVLSALLAGGEADPMKEVRVKGAGDVWIPMSLGISHVGGLTYGVARRRVRGDATTCTSWREVVGSVLEHATDMFILVDDTSRCVAVNRALAQRLGTYPAALIGVSTIDELIPSQHRGEARMALRRLLNEKAATGEIALTGADGRPAQLCYRAVANVEPGVHLCVVHAQPEAGVALANSELGGARAT
jgi:PAS domain S-box-containing protein